MAGSSAAARKAWLTRRRGGHSKPRKSVSSKRHGKRAAIPHGKKGRHKKKGKGMPENVKQYFRLISSGKSKAEAKKLAGIGSKKGGSRGGGKKAWGPGHPLYDWQHRK